MRACASGSSRSAISSAHSIGRSPSLPSRQTKRNIRRTASGSQSTASASRSSGSGLNGCTGGNLKGNAERARLPDDVPIGEAALGGNLGRSLVRVRLEQTREEHRPVTHSNRALERGQLL